MKYQNIISAVEAGNLRRARRLLDQEIAPKGSRAFDDVVGGVQSVLAGRGKLTKGVWKKELTQAAVIGLETFMESNGVKKTSRNRNIIIEFAGNFVVDVAAYIPIGMDEEELKKLRSTPLHVRLLQILASERRIAAAIDHQFPGYVGSGLLGMLGIDCDVNVDISPPSIHNLSAEEVFAVAAGVRDAAIAAGVDVKEFI